MTPAHQATLPAALLGRWRAIEQGAHPPADPVARVGAWFERLAARMLCSGGRLPRLLVETGLCDVGTLARCVDAQLDAGPLGDAALLYDVEADLDFVAEHAPLDVVEALSAKIAALPFPIDPHHGVHAELARRLLGAGRADAVGPVLARISWDLPLLDWLERHGDALDAEVRGRLLGRAARLVADPHVAPVYRVDRLVRLAVLARERAFLDRARDTLETLSAETIANAGDDEHPRAKLALGLARLGAFDEAMAELGPLDPDDQWDALLRLLPFAPGPAVRARMIDELAARAEPRGRSWWPLVEAAPEVEGRALAACEAIADEDERSNALSLLVGELDEPRARRACAWMLERASALDPDDPGWAERWERVLEALTEAGCASLLDEGARRGLIDALLARATPSLWVEAAPFVPDDRVDVVFARAEAGLAAADHYTSREAWIAVGLPLLARAPAERAAAWLELAATQMAGTGIEGAGLERLSPWSPAQQRSIVLARLAHHQQSFLPTWLLRPWLTALCWDLPPRLWPRWEAQLDAEELARGRARVREESAFPAVDPSERAAARRELDALTAGTAWPSRELVAAVFTALGRCAGADAVTAAAGALAELVGRAQSPP